MLKQPDRERREAVAVRILPLLLVAACAGCAQGYDSSYDRASHVQHVLEDVSAMIEGMAEAHTERTVVLREPDVRSSSPTRPQ
jgi:hypothetical protein